MTTKPVAPEKKMGLAIYMSYPEFTELAPHLSDEGKKVFFDGLQSAIKHAIHPHPHNIEVRDDYSVAVAIGDPKHTTHQQLMPFAEAVHKDVRLWTGTFGRIGIPPMQFEMGIAFGEIQINPTAPKITGHALAMAEKLSKEVCALFKVQVALEVDLARFASKVSEWIDLDDIELSTTPQAPKTIKRIFTKLHELEEDADIQTMKDGRRAYFQKDFATAKTKFDRLTRVKTFRHIADVYLKRMS